MGQGFCQTDIWLLSPESSAPSIPRKHLLLHAQDAGVGGEGRKRRDESSRGRGKAFFRVLPPSSYFRRERTALK